MTKLVLQAALARMKAVKALGMVLQASRALLKLTDVQAGISNALQASGFSSSDCRLQCKSPLAIALAIDQDTRIALYSLIRELRSLSICRTTLTGLSWQSTLDPTCANPRLLAAPQDEAVLVREAAVELLGRHMGEDPQTAADYFQVLLQACTDPGVSVRKRAVRILRDCCVGCATGFRLGATAVLPGRSSHAQVNAHLTSH